VVTRPQQVERRTEKVRRPKTHWATQPTNTSFLGATISD